MIDKLKKEDAIDQLMQKIKQEEETNAFHFPSSFPWIFKAKKLWIPVPLVAFTILFLFISTTGFKDPLIETALNYHQQEWPVGDDHHQIKGLQDVQDWLSEHKTKKQNLYIPKFDQVGGVELEMVRTSLIMVGEQQWKRAAHLLYHFEKQSKITVLAFNGELEKLDQGHSYTLGSTPVTTLQTGRYTIARYRKGHTVYLITSDLHEKEILHLIKNDLQQ